MTYKFTYKCRLCGAVFTDGQTGNESIATTNLLCCAFEREANISKKTIHFCDDNNKGIADLIGVKAYEV